MEVKRVITEEAEEMKRCMVCLLVMGLLFCLTACGDDTVKESEPKEETTTTQTTTTTQPEQKEVPDFIGMDYYTEIENNADYDYFDLRIVWGNANNPLFTAGQVYGQSPIPDTQVKSGTTVTLYIQSATPTDP